MRSQIAHTNCPKCSKTGHHLGASSKDAIADYYRCDGCGHVWMINKLLGTSRAVTIGVSKTQRAG